MDKDRQVQQCGGRLAEAELRAEAARHRGPEGGSRMNPVGSKEKREELRREALEEIALGGVGLCHDMPIALSGLDIAETAMRACSSWG